MSLEREEMEVPREVMSVMPGEREGREGFFRGRIFVERDLGELGKHYGNLKS